MRVAKAVQELRIKYGLDPFTAIPLPTTEARRLRKSKTVKGDPLSLVIVGLEIAVQFGSPHLTAQYQELVDELKEIRDAAVETAKDGE